MQGKSTSILQPALRTVLTGDVVASTTLRKAERSALPAMLKEVYGAFRENHRKALPYNIDVFSGDSWQIFVAEPTLAMAVAVYMRAQLRERIDVDVRIVLALDRIDFLQPDRISESDGPAFQRSGRTLAQLGKSELMRYVIPTSLEQDGPSRIAADGIADLIDHIARQWTQSQAQAVTQMIQQYPREPKQQDIADAWRPTPISQPAVNKHLQSGGWEWISRALGRFEALTRDLVHRSEDAASSAPPSTDN